MVRATGHYTYLTSGLLPTLQLYDPSSIPASSAIIYILIFAKDLETGLAHGVKIQRCLESANKELISLYWNLGRLIVEQ